MNWKARRSAGPYVLLAGMTLAWCVVAVARGDQAPVCDPRPVESNLPGAPCAVTEADRLRDQLRRERINHRLELRAALVTNRNLRKILATDPSVQEAVTIASLVSGVDRGHLWTVIRCESGGNPLIENPSPRSDAGGLVQYLSTTWNNTTFGRAGLSRFSAYANAIQAGLVMRHTMEPWRESRHCWSR